MRNSFMSGAIMIFSMVVSVVTCEAGVPDGLVLYFSFDEGQKETIVDLSGNGNDGKVAGDPEWANSKKLAFGSAISLDGDGDYIEIADSPSLGFTDAITIEAWVNIRNLTARYLIWEDWKYQDVPKPLAVMFRVNLDGIVTLWVSPDGASIGEDNELFTEEAVEMGKWYHLAATFKAGDAVIYINGEESISGTLTTETIFDSPVNKHIGNYFGVPEYADGMFDELRIWNRALNAGEIKANMEQGEKEFLAVSTKNSLTTTWGETKSSFQKR